VQPLLELTQAADYFAKAGEVALRIEIAQDLAELVDLLHEAALRLGTDVAAFLSFIGDDAAGHSFRFVLACDPQWCVDYERCAWYADDPWLAYARRHSEPVQIRELLLTSDTQRDLAQLAAGYGFRSAVLIPVPSASQLTRLGLLVLGSQRERYFDDEGLAALRVAARPVAIALHEWWVRQGKRELLDSSRITPRDLELLEHESLGHGTKEVARAMRLSPAAVNSRWQRVLVKLAASSRKVAARIAAEYGLI
jgi:DNA-binding NarL/FixJ family response regulator